MALNEFFIIQLSKLWLLSPLESSVTEVAKNAKPMFTEFRAHMERFPGILVRRPKVFPLLLGFYGDY